MKKIFITMVLCLTLFSSLFTVHVFADDTVYTLIVSNHAAEKSAMNRAVLNVLEKATELSDGRLQFEVYADGTLASAGAALSAVQTGTCDIAVLNSGSLGSDMALSTVFALPGIWEDWRDGSKAYQAMYADESSAFRQAMDGLGVHLFANMSFGGVAFASKTEITSLNQLDGLRAIVTDSARADILSQLGAIPVSMNNADSFEAISKGTADIACNLSMTGLISNGITDVAKYVYVLKDSVMGLTTMPLAINQGVYDNLPEDLQAIFDNLWTEYIIDYVYESQIIDTSAFDRFISEMDGTVNYATEEDNELYRELGKETWQTWCDSYDAQGIEASRCLEEYLTYLAK